MTFLELALRAGVAGSERSPLDSAASEVKANSVNDSLGNARAPTEVSTDHGGQVHDIVGVSPEGFGIVRIRKSQYDHDSILVGILCCGGRFITAQALSSR